MSENAMTMWNHFYYRKNPDAYNWDFACPEGPKETEWFHCDMRPWNGVDTDDCWYEYSFNACGYEQCTYWSENDDGSWFEDGCDTRMFSDEGQAEMWA